MPVRRLKGPTSTSSEAERRSDRARRPEPGQCLVSILRSGRIRFTSGWPRLHLGGRRVHERKGETTLEQIDRLPYEEPMVLDTFDAQEVMGSAEGFIYGSGSRHER
jgi:hypothetical protein